MLIRSVLVLIVSLFAACAPAGMPSPLSTPSSSRDTGASTAALVVANLPFASASERQARLGAVRSRLGPTWELTWYSAEQLHPTSGFIENPTRWGNKTSAEIESIASTFLATNGDLFGLSAADLGAMSFELEWVDNRFWRYSGGGLRTTPGYEAFPGLHRRLSVSVEVWREGTVIGVTAQGQELPPVQLNTHPGLSDVAPAVRGKVIGHEVAAVENPPGPYVSGAARLIGRGPVAAADITGVRLDFFMEPDPANQQTSFILVYVFEVTKFEGNRFTFWVDANTGALIGAQDEASVFRPD